MLVSNGWKSDLYVLISTTFGIFQIIELTDFKDNLEEFIRNPITANSPKVTEHVGQVIGPLLISHAGKIVQLNCDRGFKYFVLPWIKSAFV